MANEHCCACGSPRVDVRYAAGRGTPRAFCRDCWNHRWSVASERRKRRVCDKLADEIKRKYEMKTELEADRRALEGRVNRLRSELVALEMAVSRRKRSGPLAWLRARLGGAL